MMYLTLLPLSFVLSVMFYPTEVHKYLGNSMQVVALICFAIAAVALVIYSFKFLKASLTILCWGTVLVVAGSVAFPDLEILSHIKRDKVEKAVTMVMASLRSNSLE